VEANTTHTRGVAGALGEGRTSLFGRLTSQLSSKRVNGEQVTDKPHDDPTARIDHYLRDSEAVALHQRRLPGERRAVSHLIVGPSGVTVIDSHKYASRRAKLEGGVLRVGGRERSDLIRGLLRQVEGVRELLAGTPYANVPVEAALARRKVEGVPVLQGVNEPRVIVCGTRRIAGEASRPGRLSSRRVKALAAYLDRVLA
jgi:hypothetical protein